MIIVETYVDVLGCRRLDFGYDVETGKMIILPPEILDCDRMGIYYDDEIGEYVMIKKEPSSVETLYEKFKKRK